MIRQQLNDALKEGMRSKNSGLVSTVRLILAALKDRDIAERGKGNTEGLSDAETMQMLASMVKQREESIKMYEQGGRLELAERERGEIEVIQQFMPRQLDESETEAAVQGLIAETGAQGLKDMGKLMAELRARYAGQLDMGKASGLAKKLLGA